MNGVIISEKASFQSSIDGLNTYHAELFHGRVVNDEVDDNNLGDVLRIRLQLEKDAYDCKYIFKPQRNLVIPESAKQKLLGVPNIDFFEVIFKKLFFAPYRKGDLSVGPEDYRDLDKWLDSFPHQERLLSEVEKSYELILPLHDRLLKSYINCSTIECNVESWCMIKIQLSQEMLSTYPAIWSPEGIIFREDVLALIEDFFCWDYFIKAVFRV